MKLAGFVFMFIACLGFFEIFGWVDSWAYPFAFIGVILYIEGVRDEIVEAIEQSQKDMNTSFKESMDRSPLEEEQD